MKEIGGGGINSQKIPQKMNPKMLKLMWQKVDGW